MSITSRDHKKLQSCLWDVLLDGEQPKHFIDCGCLCLLDFFNFDARDRLCVVNFFVDRVLDDVWEPFDASAVCDYLVIDRDLSLNRLRLCVLKTEAWVKVDKVFERLTVDVEDEL